MIISLVVKQKRERFLRRKNLLSERLKTLQRSQEELPDIQALLNKREDIIFSSSQELNRREKDFEDEKSNSEMMLKP
ncbi:hypothetical protein HAX54_011343 [Datura stramonium]|uniref:Uncharacterized protein n=1 Tax=Datura stramonium TaxID=4076 RepID=A0ABS8TJQ0_DATST|nr:hypothetical protein [Datura stramonium]